MRAGTVEKSKSRLEARLGSCSNLCGAAPATNAAARCSGFLATTAVRAPSVTRYRVSTAPIVPCPITQALAPCMVMSVFSITIFKRPSTIAGVRCSIKLRSHSYSCNLIDNASACIFRFLSAQPRMMCASGSIRESNSRSGIMGLSADGANSAPLADMPGIGNSANFALSSTAAGSLKYVTPAMPPSGHGKPYARTSAPVAAARRAISCSRLSPPSIAMRRLFQSIVGASAAMALRSNKSQQAVAIQLSYAHPLRCPAGRRGIEADQHPPDLQQRVCHRNVDAANPRDDGERQKPIAEVLLIIPVSQRIWGLDPPVGLSGRNRRNEIFDIRC